MIEVVCIDDLDKDEETERHRHKPWMDRYVCELIERIDNEDSVDHVETFGSFFDPDTEEFKDIDVRIFLQDHIDGKEAIVEWIWNSGKRLVQELALDPLQPQDYKKDSRETEREEMRIIFAQKLDAFFVWNGIEFRPNKPEGRIEVILRHSTRSKGDICAILRALKRRGCALHLPQEYWDYPSIS
jgi:hypothetical protein